MPIHIYHITCLLDYLIIMYFAAGLHVGIHESTHVHFEIWAFCRKTSILIL